MFPVFSNFFWGIRRGIADEDDHVHVSLQVNMTIEELDRLIAHSALYSDTAEEGLELLKIFLEFRCQKNFLSTIIVAIDDYLHQERPIYVIHLQIFYPSHDEPDLPDEFVKSFLHGVGAINTDDDLSRVFFKYYCFV